MRVFAEEIRSVAELLYFVLLFTYLMHALRRRIHLARNIIGLLFCMYGAFIVHRKSRILLQIFVFLVCIVRTARLVAKAPHHDGRMHLVSLIHPRGTVNIMSFPLRVIADAVIARRQFVDISAVSLEVGFINNVYAQLVADLQQVWVRRIV